MSVVGINDKEPNYRNEFGSLILIRCFLCEPNKGKGNKPSAVSMGVCGHCNWSDKPLRNDVEVINDTLVHFPDDIKKRLLENLSFCAPEIMLSSFVYYFNSNVPRPPVEEWHFRAVAALQNKSYEEIVDNFKRRGGH